MSYDNSVIGGEPRLGISSLNNEDVEIQFDDLMVKTIFDMGQTAQTNGDLAGLGLNAQDLPEGFEPLTETEMRLENFTSSNIVPTFRFLATGKPQELAAFQSPDGDRLFSFLVFPLHPAEQALYDTWLGNADTYLHFPWLYWYGLPHWGELIGPPFVESIEGVETLGDIAQGYSFPYYVQRDHILMPADIIVARRGPVLIVVFAMWGRAEPKSGETLPGSQGPNKDEWKSKVIIKAAQQLDERIQSALSDRPIALPTDVSAPTEIISDGLASLLFTIEDFPDGFGTFAECVISEDYIHEQIDRRWAERAIGLVMFTNQQDGICQDVYVYSVLLTRSEQTFYDFLMDDINSLGWYFMFDQPTLGSGPDSIPEINKFGDKAAGINIQAAYSDEPYILKWAMLRHGPMLVIVHSASTGENTIAFSDIVHMLDKHVNLVEAGEVR